VLSRDIALCNGYAVYDLAVCMFVLLMYSCTESGIAISHTKN